jgi:hypothetical protein
MGKSDKHSEAMRQLFSARWNVPQAAKHCGIANDVCKELFKLYCSVHPATYKNKKSRKKTC